MDLDYIASLPMPTLLDWMAHMAGDEAEAAPERTEPARSSSGQVFLSPDQALGMLRERFGTK